MKMLMFYYISDLMQINKIFQDKTIFNAMSKFTVEYCLLDIYTNYSVCKCDLRQNVIR